MPRRLQRIPTWILVSGLLALYAALAGVAAVRDSVTYDETEHLPSGYAALDRGDFRLAPTHPPLARMLAALPVRIAGAVPDPGYDLESWKTAHSWTFGYAFLNGPPSDAVRRDPDRALRPARCAMIALGLALGLVVFAWSRDLWGTPGALASLFLYVLSPATLAHGHLVTTDLPAALGYASTLWCFWRFCRDGTKRWVIATGLALGFALLVKFSCVWLLPTLVLLGAAWVVAAPERSTRRARLLRATAAIAGMLAIATVCIWAGYGFRFAITPDGSYEVEWESWARATPGLAYRLCRFAGEHRLLPEAFVYGFAGASETIVRATYLNGKTFMGGTWQYFPEAILLKTTPAVLLLAGWAIVEGVCRTRGRSLALWFIAVPAVVYLLVAIGSGLNIGHRHLLPLYPLVFVAIGALTRLARGGRRAQLALAAVLLSHAVSSFSAMPRYLTYFNVAAGGTSRGWRYLLDSNLDWGQDLVRLRETMTEHGLEEIYLFYFGTGDPSAYGIRYKKCHLVPDLRPDLPRYRVGPGDVFAISVQLRTTMIGKDFDAVRNSLTPFDKVGDSIFLYRLPR